MRFMTVPLILLSCAGGPNHGAEASHEVARRAPGMGAGDLFAQILDRAEGRCNLTYLTHTCEISMYPHTGTPYPHDMLVMVEVIRTHVNPDDVGAEEGDVYHTFLYAWDTVTGEVSFLPDSSTIR